MNIPLAILIAVIVLIHLLLRLIGVRIGRCSHCKFVAIKFRVAEDSKAVKNSIDEVEIERCLNLVKRHPKVPNRIIK